MRRIRATLDRMGIVWKLSLPIVAVIVLTTSVAVALTVIRVRSQFEDAGHRTFIADAARLAAVIDRELAAGRPIPGAAIDVTLAMEADRGLAAYAVVARDDGTLVLLSSRGLPAEAVAQAPEAMRRPAVSGAAMYVNHVRILDQPFTEVASTIPTGAGLRLFLGHRDAALTAAALAGVAPIVGALMASTALALLVVVGVARVIRRRARALQDQVERVTIGDYQDGLADPSRDELGRLARGLRTMVRQLRERQAEVRRLTVELRSRASRDSLTGQLNHVTMERHIQDQVSLAPEEPFALVTVDVDNFRLLNETHGHAVGDNVLRWIGRACRAQACAHDSVGRYAADQFMVLLRRADADRVDDYVTRLCAVVDAFDSGEVGAGEFSLSVSVGSARYPEHGRSPDALLARADTDVYRARFGVRDAAEPADPQATAQALDMRDGFEPLVGLVAAVDAKDDYTMRHSELVADYVTLLAAAHGLGAETQRLLRIAGLVHDVGKIGVADSILKKPGRLTTEEMAAMRTHVELSTTLVQFAMPDRSIIDAVAHHHERWDGDGYPHGLAADAVPLVGRMMIIADAMSAMTLDRPYRRGLHIDAALAQLVAGAGTQFDPDLVPVFVDALLARRRDVDGQRDFTSLEV